MRLTHVLLLSATALVAGNAAAQARIFCCTDGSGRKVCSDFIPKECENRAYEERDGKGYVVKNYEAPLTPEQQRRRLAEQAKKDEEARKAMEERRRTQALLATYAAEKDIDAARDRALAEVEKNLKQAQSRLDEALKKKKKLDGEKEFYKGKAVPPEVKAQMRDNESEIKAQQAAVDTKSKEMDEVRAKFEEEKKRFLELKGKKPTTDTAPPAPAVTPPAAPAATPPAPPPAAPAAKPAEKK